MTGGCTCLIYYQGVVRVEKGSVIIRYKLAELMKNSSARTPPLAQPCFMAWLGKESNPALPLPCFKHDRRVYLSGILPGSCEYCKRKLDNSLQITWAYQNRFLGGAPALPQPCFKHDGCTCPIYYQGVVSVDKGSVIIRYKKKQISLSDIPWLQESGVLKKEEW